MSPTAVLFDMDGVLFDSMPYHAKAWHKAMAEFGLDLSEEEAYMHEGRTGFSTIQIITARKGLTATREMADEMYRVKSAYFSQFPDPAPMPGALPLIRKMQAEGIMLLLVTGSGTTTLLQQLNEFYPDVFVPERMVTGFDVKKGKPDPEPYLMGLAKGSAPLGVRAAVAAHIPTIAVNTGPLPDHVLLDEGAKWLFPSMQALCDAWPRINN